MLPRPGPAAHDVGDHAGQLRAGHVADAFLHQADAGTARRRHGAHAGGGGAVQHVDGGHFALGLQKDAAGLRHVERGGFGNLAGRRDGIAVEGAAAGQNRALHDGFVALDQLFAHRLHPPLTAAARSTVIAPGSGHAKKQMPQPVQPAPA